MPEKIIRITRRLVRELEPLRFSEPIACVYNPLVYARRAHEQYIRRFARKGVESVLLGINGGPFGMAQTGVPFGEVNHVRDWLKIEEKIDKPPREHPKRPVLGFDCPRSEVSGARLWGWAKETFGRPERFFKQFYIVNFCPLIFMEESGRNLTPDRCPAQQRDRLFEICTRALRDTVQHLGPRRVIGGGNFAEGRARECCEGLPVEIGKLLHPSPRSPAANRGWAEAARKDLERCGVKLPA